MATSRETGPRALLFLCALRITSLFSSPDIEAIIEANLLLVSSSEGVRSADSGGSGASGGAAILSGGAEGGSGIASTLDKNGLQPSSGVCWNDVMQGESESESPTSHLESCSLSTRDWATSGENHCISNDHMRARSLELIAPSSAPLKEEQSNLEISISTSEGMFQGLLAASVLHGCPEQFRAWLKCGASIRVRFSMPREYIARDPRTGKRIGVSKKGGRKTTGFAALSPDSGPWQRLEISEILPLATGESEKVEILTDGKRWKLGRIDAIKALSKVGERDAERAYETLVDALEDNFPDVRIAALKVLPSFALRRQGILLHCLSDRLLDEEEAVREEAMNCLKKIAPLFPSGCEDVIRRELRDERKVHRDNAFETLKLCAREWPEVGCLHLDEIIREKDVDLRIRGSLILRTVASKGGAGAWDLITWSLQDEEVRVRRNAAKTLTVLADVEPRVAVILVESSLGENDRVIRNSVIKALKKLDIQSPRVVQMILKGASDDDLDMRRACVGQISIILSGQELREAAGELLKKEKDPSLRKRLQSLALDPDFEGSEEEKNRKLAPAEYVPNEDEDQPLPNLAPLGEDDKRQSGRPASEESR